MSSVSEPKQARSQATRRRLLDAAVEELVEHGYAKLTTQSVARRAGVSRGAQQHHFPDKAALVGEAVRHLILLQIEELRTTTMHLDPGRGRTERVLDVLFEVYSGPLFAAAVEMVLGARGDAELAQAVAPLEIEVGRTMTTQAADLFGPEITGLPDFDRRLRHVVATIRGLALLRFLGHPERAIAAQWRFTRPELVRLLTGAD